jgi:hypothetical protein
MACVTAAFPEAPPFDGRVFGGVVIGLGTVAAAGVIAAMIIVVATWVVAAALSTNPYIHARASIGPETVAVNYRYPALASAVDVSASATVLTNPDALSEAKLGPVASSTSAPVDTAPPLMKRPPERADDVLWSPYPSTAEPLYMTRETTDLADSRADAAFAPAAAPHSPVPPTRASQPTKRAQVAPQVSAAPAPAPTSNPQKPFFAHQGHSDANLLPGPDSRTAVYDIEAHTVYLPDGDKLEAHSGLGKRLDDPRYVSEKNRGPTPPNVYDLVLRSERFHGVRAIRLNPVNESDMFGRDGMLAHTYMLGPSGQSFGCVSFKDYSAFLQAFLEGEIDRLIVVPHLGDAGVTVSRSTPARRRHADRYAYNHG